MINTATASIQELKEYANTNSIEIKGDKRRKQSYIDAIEATLVEIEEAIEEVTNDVLVDTVASVEVRVESVEVNAQIDSSDVNGLLLVIVVYLVLATDIYRGTIHLLKPHLTKLVSHYSLIVTWWFYDNVSLHLTDFCRKLYSFKPLAFSL